ncbi:PF00070 family, FAD-dependent NAD(P)-disulfide oxidoreductase [Minicystis rosea]|nr:PF00070 family, FAD-dependent NAD(P)-disulfide oxidoreductase [Minicystis rosea]
MKVDVIIVGSGQAGVPLAARLAQAGKEVAIIERGELGGTCVNNGCTPTKAMIASARAAHVARTAGRLGVRTGAVTVDLPAIVDRKDDIVHRWRAGVDRRLRSAGDRLHLVRGQARFVGERALEASGQRLEAPIVILNVGARPTVPALPGLDRVPFLTSSRALDLREIPGHLIVLGGGYIGCELGQMFRRFGAEVTVVDHNPHLLSREDPDVSEALERAFTAEGIRLVLGAKVDRIDTDGAPVAVHLADGDTLRGTHLLVATGRRPNTDDLGCDVAGVRLDARGLVIVDDGYATSAPGVYAVGDVAGPAQFTHTSWDDHRILFDRLLGRSDRGRKDRVIPYAVFTDPQVAGVGLGEREAKARGIPYEVATMSFGDIARSIEIDETFGTMKILLDPATERILGVRLVGAEAGELLHIFVPLVEAGASASSIVRAEFVHPTFAEGIQSLVMRLPRFALH